jgi:hypothetical protein
MPQEPNDPAADGQGDLDAPIVIDLDLLTTGDDEDMEAYTGLDDVMARIYAAVRAAVTDGERAARGELDGPVPLLIERIRPAKLRVALLGVMKRKADPSFGPERWRELPYAAHLRPLPTTDEQADPTQAADQAASEPPLSAAPRQPPSSAAPPPTDDASPPTPPSP